MAEEVKAIYDISVTGSCAGAEDASLDIVYVVPPEGEDPEAFHIRTLTSVLGSEEAAKLALVYHYKHAASGFAAKLTPQQAADLAKKPGVVQVVPCEALHPHGGSAA
ncbi:hypothetical protein HPP92_000925 [Vanilla planifolia]|uniref:Inhibitor I9 domain-containing protein n=1 Tax=Vanilla planifolia TaxID=51239 RepID=A0A835SBP1_VANPL|nr:hypothetical protein HPP92_001081 [Vanilla planifolia]KAG0500853.1 hypothetical protein HPP92_000925 [Vanilla planifolia]